MNDNININTPSGESHISRQWLIDNIQKLKIQSTLIDNTYFINYKDTNTTFSISKKDWNETLSIIRNQKINQILQ